MRLLIIHGPNLNLLGEREPSIYGTQTLEQLNTCITDEARELGIAVRCMQSNSEGAIIDALHEARLNCDGVIINPGAYSHYSLAIADAIRSIAIPVVEVHLSNTAAREEARRISVVAAACRGSVAGFGCDSYLLALRSFAKKA